MTKIEWAEESWNPVTGCTRVSEGCRHCYAERQAVGLAANVPFSLSCQDCDLGDDVTSLEDADAKGWIEIDYDPDGISWWWIGVCPECKKSAERGGDEPQASLAF